MVWQKAKNSNKISKSRVECVYFVYALKPLGVIYVTLPLQKWKCDFVY